MHPWLQRIRKLVDSWLGACLGAALYAAWAVAVNWEMGMYFALKVGGVHWLMSALLTYYGTLIMRQFYYRAYRTPKAQVLAALFGGLGTTYGLLIPVHFFLGTPNILLTLAAGIVPTVLFCTSYALLLSKTGN